MTNKEKIFLVLFLLITVIILINIIFSGTHIIFDFLSLVPQWIYLLPLLLLLGMSQRLSKRKYYYSMLVCSLMVFITIYLIDIELYSQPVHSNNSQELKIMSWNTSVWNKTKEDKYYDVIAEYDADIILFQEVPQGKRYQLPSEISKRFPQRSIVQHGEFLTISKFPILNSHRSRKNGFSLATILIQGKEYSIYNVHLARPNYISSFSESHFYVKREEQFNELKESLSSDSNPIIIAGDFNTPRNYPYIQYLDKHFVLNNPIGLLQIPLTYNSSYPFIRIDYQFVSHSMRFTEYKEIVNPLSDHKIIYSKVDMQE